MTGGSWPQSMQWRMDSFTVDAALPVATEPVYGIPDPNLQPMQLLSVLSKDAGPTQVASVRWQNQPGTAAALSAPGEDTGEARAVGYIPASTPEATVDWAKARLGYVWWLVLCVVMQVINPFLVLPLLYMVDEQAAWQVFGAYFFVGVYSFFSVPFIWLGLMIYSLVKFPQKRRRRWCGQRRTARSGTTRCTTEPCRRLTTRMRRGSLRVLQRRRSSFFLAHPGSDSAEPPAVLTRVCWRLSGAFSQLLSGRFQGTIQRLLVRWCH